MLLVTSAIVMLVVVFLFSVIVGVLSDRDKLGNFIGAIVATIIPAFLIWAIIAEFYIWDLGADAIVSWIGMPYILAWIIIGVLPMGGIVVFTFALLLGYLGALVSEF